MRTDTTTPRYGRTPHLVGLVAETERLAALVSGAAPKAVEDAQDELRARAVVATLRLDGSPIEQPPDVEALAVDATAVPAGSDRGATSSGSWFDAMSVFEDEHRDRIIALEYLGARAAVASDDLAETLLVDPLGSLATLHRRLTRGLLVEDVAGMPRTSEQAVHDASTGRIIYYAPDPGDIVSRLALLGSWLQTTGAREHGLIVSGVLHLELLHLHPYAAANGRLARTAARLALRARGLDPHGLATPEETLALAPLGYYEDVAATVRRRDLTVWLERWGEAVSAGLRTAAHRLGVLDRSLPERPAAFLAGWDGPAFTIADYRAEAQAGPEAARADLEAALDAGAVLRVPGSRGLRFERRSG